MGAAGFAGEEGIHLHVALHGHKLVRSAGKLIELMGL